MLTQEERLKQAFERGQAQLQQKQDDDAALRAAYEKYHPAEGGGAAVNVGSAKRSISPGAAIGAIVGGVAGGVATAPAGGGGALPGAIIGAGLGELGQQAYDHMTGSAYAPHSLEDSAMRVGKEMGYTAAGEVGARAITFLKPVAYAQPRALTPEQQQVKGFLDQHRIPYTPDQITGSAFHSFARSIADNGMFSEKQMVDFVRDQNEAIRGAVTDIANTMGQHVPLAKLGVEVANYATNRSTLIRDAIIDPWYNTIAKDLEYTQQMQMVPTGRQVPIPGQFIDTPTGRVPKMQPEMVEKPVTQGGLLVDIRPLKDKFAAEVANLEKDAINTGDRDFAKLRDTNPAYGTMKDFLSTEDQIQWTAAHGILKTTREKLRRLENPLDTVSSRLYDKGTLGEGERLLNKQMGVALEQSADPAHARDLALWKQAQAVVKGRAEQFKNDVVMRFVNEIDKHGGDKGMVQFMNSMTADDMGKVWQAVRSNPDLQNSMRRAFLEDRIIKAGGMDAADAPFNAEKFRKVVFGKDEMNAHKTDVLFNTTQRQKLEEFTNAVSAVQRQDTADKFGSVFIRMKSSGAVFTLPNVIAGSLLTMGGVSAVQGDMTTAGLEAGGALSIVVGPKVLANMLTNPRATEYMIQGLRYSAVDRSNTLRIARELMRLDQGFAHAVRTGLSDHFAEPVPPARTAETTTLAPATTSPTLGSMMPSFGLQQ